MKWGNRDWIWLILVIIVLATSFYIREPGVNNILSFISSFASISLAGVAIYISVREATKTDNVKDEIHTLVGELNEKVRQIDKKIDKIDLVNAQKNVKTDQIDDLVRMLRKKDV